MQHTFPSGSKTYAIRPPKSLGTTTTAQLAHKRVLAHLLGYRRMNIKGDITGLALAALSAPVYVCQ